MKIVILKLIYLILITNIIASVSFIVSEFKLLYKIHLPKLIDFKGLKVVRPNSASSQQKCSEMLKTIEKDVDVRNINILE